MNKTNKNEKRSSFYNTSEILNILKQKAVYRANDFSPWEKGIIEIFQKSKLRFETKFREFYFDFGKEKFVYLPDLLVKGFEYDEKQILIEAHEEISEYDVKKYRRFRSIYGSVYHLIMIVTDGELRKWNEYDRGEQGLFHEIWTSEDIDFLINDLLDKKDKYKMTISQYQQSAVCPLPPKGHGCGRKASGYNEVVRWFGYRGKRVQSLCRECRSEQSRKYRTTKNY